MNRIIGLGEILWDVFPDGPRFGGAPANFACSVAALAKEHAEVWMVSAVGDDALGRDAIAELTQMQVNTSAVQVNPFQTGRVDVQLDNSGVATYQFAEDTAWDHLQWTSSIRKVVATCDAVCFGTLGQRDPCSREVIQSFVRAVPESALKLFDVNLRAPYFSDAVILQSLELSNVLKLNDDELPIVARLCGLDGTDVEIMQQLAARYHLRAVALTRGPDGAVICTQDTVSQKAGKPVDVVDTVGAGDAFSAAMTMGLLHNQDIDQVIERAIATASYVCSRPGATMPLPDSLKL